MFTLYRIALASFFVATRKVLRYSMNSNDTELEKFVHTHIKHRAARAVSREGLVL